MSKRMAQQTQVHRMASRLLRFNHRNERWIQPRRASVLESCRYANGNRVNLLKLRGDRIDCYVNDRISILWELTRLKREGIVDTVNFSMAAKISLEQGYIGFTNQNLEQYPYQSQFVAAFNSALAELKSSGQLDKIVGRYIE